MDAVAGVLVDAGADVFVGSAVGVMVGGAVPVGVAPDDAGVSVMTTAGGGISVSITGGSSSPSGVVRVPSTISVGMRYGVAVGRSASSTGLSEKASSAPPASVTAMTNSSATPAAACLRQSGFTPQPPLTPGCRSHPAAQAAG